MSTASAGRPVLSAGGHVIIGGNPYVIRVEISDIRLPDNHCAMNLDAVTAYAKLLRAGHTPPPPLVTPNTGGEGYWLLDGRHRFIAHIATGESSMTVLCTDGATIQHTEPVGAGVSISGAAGTGSYDRASNGQNHSREQDHG